MIHAPQRFSNLAVGRSRLHAQDPLPHRGEKLLHGQRVCVFGLETQALEPGAGHEEAVTEPFVELAQPRVHVAAYGLDAEVGTPGEQQGAPPETRGGDAGAPRQLVEPASRSREQDVTRVFARRIGRQREAAGKLCRHVLEAVHARVNPAVKQRLLDLPDEERLASEVREGHLRETVAGRADDHDLDLRSARAQRVRNLPGLSDGDKRALIAFLKLM